jgi:hypothetical protein
MSDQDQLWQAMSAVTETDIANIRTDFALPREFFDSLIDEIDVRSDFRNFVHHQFQLAATVYELNKWTKAHSISRSEGRESLKTLKSSFDSILETLSDLPIEQSLALGGMLAQAGDRDALGALRASRVAIEQLRDAAARFVREKKYRGGRLPFENLEMTVGALMLAIELATGNRATAVLTKDGDYVKKSTSPQADAIIRLLTRVDPELEEGSIIRKIERINTRYRKRKLTGFASAVLVTIGARIPEHLLGPAHRYSPQKKPN